MDIDDEGDEAGKDSVSTEVRPSKNSNKTKHNADRKGTTGAKGKQTPVESKEPERKSLSNFARLDTLVTVVDALNLFDVLSTLETLAEKNSTHMVGNTGIAQGDTEEEIDDRSIAQLMLDQIEFANVIVLSKAHLLGSQAGKPVSGAGSSSQKSAQVHKPQNKGRKQLVDAFSGQASAAAEMSNEAAVCEVAALIKKLNPKANVIVPKEPKFADVRIADLVNTHLFDMDEAQEGAGWIAELEKEEGEGHTPETEEYGIGSVVFRSKERPFHPHRLRAILAGFGNYKLSVARAAGDHAFV